MKTALHKSEIPFSQIFAIRRLNEKHFDPVWHAHSEFQLFVVLEGTGTRFIGDSIKSFRPGELVFTGPHLPHLWRSDEVYFDRKNLLSTEGIVIYFGENFLGDHIMDKEEMAMLKKLFAGSMRGLEFYGQKKTLVVNMMHQLIELQGIKSVILFLQILELLAGTKEYHYISSKGYKDTFNKSETDRLNIVYDYVLKNFRQKILLDDLAELLHMTPTSFSRYFTMKNNKSFSKFVSEIRIKHACKLLTETNNPIEEICYECGFNTPSNFNKQFKYIMLKKPTDYKREFLSI
ncbi:MAG: AraC family transcriptional regulator [Ferruginibacter sp.]